MGITLGYTSPTYMMCGCVWIKMDNVHRTAIWIGKINYDKQWNYRVPLSRQTNTIILLTNLDLRHLKKWEIGHTQIGNSANKYENVLFSVWKSCTEELDDILQLILGDQDRNDTLYDFFLLKSVILNFNCPYLLFERLSIWFVNHWNARTIAVVNRRGLWPDVKRSAAFLYFPFESCPLHPG